MADVLGGGGDQSKNEEFGDGGADDELDSEPLISPLDEVCSDELLVPLERIGKYFNSDELFDREIAARDITSAVIMADSLEELDKLCDFVVFLSGDGEPVIRMSVVMQILNVVRRCSEVPMMDEERLELQQRLLNIPIAYLTDPNEQVRRGSHLCLANTLEEKGDDDEIVQQICEAVALLFSNDSSYEFRLDGLVILSRISGCLGGDILLREFMPFFDQLSCDNMFHVRKAFAMCCKELSPALSVQQNEQFILPLFLNLCKDEAWGVRKACADVYIDVAASCSLSVRHSHLTKAFVQLLDDTSRWVRKAAYQSLGPFITTFKVEDEGGEDAEEGKDLSSLEPADSRCEQKPEAHWVVTGEGKGCMGQQVGDNDGHSEASPISSQEDVILESAETWIEKHLEVVSLTECGREHALDGSSCESTEYNDVLFWRQPIPDLDLNLLNDRSSRLCSTEEVGRREETRGEEKKAEETEEEEENKEVEEIEEEEEEEEEEGNEREDKRQGGREESTKDAPVLEDKEVIADRVVVHFEDDVISGSTGREGPMPLHSLLRASSQEMLMHSTPAPRTNNLTASSDMELTIQMDLSPRQAFPSVVPLELLKFYFGMVEQVRVQQVHGELPFLCAFSFPGVAITLGADNWHLMKSTFDILSQHMHWKIRRALAFSMHDLAQLLGPEKTVSDILPVFKDFLKDVEDVRIGILSSLSQLYKILPESKLVECLPLVQEFLDDHNERNWRYRLKLVEQLSVLCEVYYPDMVSLHITPLAIALAQDKVAELREAASDLICTILCKLEHVLDQQCHILISTVRSSFALSSSWKQRMTFIDLCEKFLQTRCVSLELFRKECLPQILTMHTDRVPNIRMAVARVVSLIVYNSDVATDDSGIQEQLEGALSLLREDKDNDVRCSAGGEPLQRCLTMNSDSSGSEEPWFQDQDDRPSVEPRGVGGLGFQQPFGENEGLQDVNSIEDSVFEATQKFNVSLVVEKNEGEREEGEGEMLPSGCTGQNVVTVQQMDGGEVVKWTKMGGGEGEHGLISVEGSATDDSEC